MRNLQRQFSYLYRESASILIICVWILVFFSALSVGLYRIVSTQMKFTKILEERAICQYLAKSACLYYKFEKTKDEIPYDSLYKLRNPQTKELGKSKFTYTIVDEESRININTASCEVIARLPGMDLELAQAIMASHLRPFQRKEEILLVEGMTKEIFDGIKEFITVYTDGKININTAPSEVLIALGLDETLVKAIEGFRAGEDGKEATEDDNIFKEVGTIISQLRSYISFSSAQEAELVSLISQQRLTTAAKNPSLNIETMVYGRQAMKYAIVMNTEKWNIKQWREY